MMRASRLRNIDIQRYLAGLRSHRRTAANSFWALSGNVVHAGAKWGVLLILARMTDPASVGQYALAFAISAPVMMFTDMRLRLLLAADTQNDFRFADYVRTRLMLSTLALAGICLFGLLAFGAGKFLYILIAVALAKTVESFGDVIYGLFLLRKRIIHMSISLFMKGGLSLALFLLVLGVTGNVVAACFALPFAWCLPLLFYDVPTAARLAGGYRAMFSADDRLTEQQAGGMFRLIRMAIVLGFVGLLGSLFSNVTSYVIGSTLGDTQLGYYAAMAYFGFAGLLVATSLAQPMIPTIAAAYRGGDARAFRLNYLYLMLLAFILGGAGILFATAVGEPFLVLVYGEAYAGNGDLFILAMTAVAAFYFVQFHWIIFTAMRELNIQLVLSAMTLVLMLILCLILAPRYGIAGALCAEIAAFGAHGLLGVLHVLRKTRTGLGAAG